MGATASRSEGSTAPRRWSRDHFALIELGERSTDHLAVCVAHRGAHVWHGDACQQLPPRGRRRRLTPLTDSAVGVLIEDRVYSALRRAQAARQAERGQ